MEKKKVFQAAECFYFLEEDVTVRMDVIDIGYVGFHHKHEELVIYNSRALSRAKPLPEAHHV